MADKRGASRNKAAKKTAEPINMTIDWQKWLRLSFALMVLAVFVGASMWLHQDTTLPIKHVTVAGNMKNTAKDDLIKAVTPFVTGNFLSVDVASIQKAGEKLPWVKQVQVRRMWPDKIHLIVQEQQAIAFWNDKALVNQDGELFTPTKASFPKGLVTLNGDDGSSKLMLQQLIDIHKQTSSLGLKVSQLQMDQRRAWTVLFTNEMTLLLGRAESKKRLQRFIDVYQTELADYQDRIEKVDMRYTNGLAVVWKQGQQPDFYGTV
jgi:cell division protein FtsQ